MTPDKLAELLQRLNGIERYLLDNEMWTYAGYVKEAAEIIEKDEKEIGCLIQKISIADKYLTTSESYLSNAIKLLGYPHEPLEDYYEKEEYNGTTEVHS